MMWIELRVKGAARATTPLAFIDLVTDDRVDLHLFAVDWAQAKLGEIVQ